MTLEAPHEETLTPVGPLLGVWCSTKCLERCDMTCEASVVSGEPSGECFITMVGSHQQEVIRREHLTDDVLGKLFL